MRRAVEPAVLGPGAVRPLDPLEVAQRAQRRHVIARLEERRRHVEEVSRPDQVIDLVAVAHLLAPGRAGSGDEGPRVRLVLEAAQDAHRGPGQKAAVARHLEQVGRQVGQLPAGPCQALPGPGGPAPEALPGHLLGVDPGARKPDSDLEGPGVDAQPGSDRGVAPRRRVPPAGEPAVVVVEVDLHVGGLEISRLSGLERADDGDPPLGRPRPAKAEDGRIAVEDEAVVTGRSLLQVGRGLDVERDVRHLGQELPRDQDRVQIGIARELLDQPVLAVPADRSEGRHAGLDPAHVVLGLERVVDRRRAGSRDQEAELVQAGLVELWKEDLAQVAQGHCEPDARLAARRGAKPLLAPGSPRGPGARNAWSLLHARKVCGGGTGRIASGRPRRASRRGRDGRVAEWSKAPAC